MEIVQLSDIHLSGYMTRESVRRAVDMANDVGADLAVVTGDLITGMHDPSPIASKKCAICTRRSAFMAAMAIMKFTPAPKILPRSSTSKPA